MGVMMKKDEKNEFLKEIIFFVISGIIITTIAYFIHTFPVKASSVDNDNTYISEYFPCGQNDNGWPMQEILQKVSETGNFSYSDYEWSLYCGLDVGFYGGWVIMSDDFIFGEVRNDLHSFNLYKTGSTTFRCFEIEVGKDFTWCNVYERDYLPAGLESSLYATNYNYVSNYQLWTTSNPSNAKLVINYKPTPPWETTEPNPFEDMPDDEPNTPPTKPTWDDNLTAGENIGNLIKWLGDTVVYLFNNLKRNLFNLFDTIKKTIENAIETFYNNMQSLFKPFIDKVVETYEYLTEPVNTTDIVNSIGNMQIYTDITTITNSVSNFSGFFNGVSEPDTLVFPVHLENIPLLNCNTVYIDLGVINSIKTPFRLLLMCLTTFSIFFTVLDSLPNYINGGGDES